MFMNYVNLSGFVHREKNQGSQDYISRRNRRGVNVMCLCDGAGSYAHTALGAHRLSASMSLFVCEQFYNLLKTDDQMAKMLIVSQIRKCIRELRNSHGCIEENAYASTMICAAMEARTGRYIAFHLGDGFLAAVKDGAVGRLTVPGEYGNGDTCSATVLSTSDAKLLLADLKVVRGVAEGIMMSSDGAEGLLYNRGVGGVRAMANTIVDGVRRVGPGCADMLLERAASAFHAMDDISIGLMLRGAPAPDQMGFCYGMHPHRESLRQRRVLRSFGEYAVLRDMGMSPPAAACRAGWGRRSTAKRAYCANRLGVY